MITDDSLVQSLIQCVKHCDECASACLEEKHVAKLVTCIKNNIECAEFCRVTAKMLQLNSLHARPAVELCMSVCSSCREECEKHDHVHCKTCAIVCRECEKLCSEWLNLVSVNQVTS